MWQWLLRLIAPRWSSSKLDRFLDAKPEDFLQKFYDDLDKEEDDAGHR